jgi:hypothetical protein
MEKEIYFHVGLGKTGSTYLQYKVFPKFKNIYYIQRTKYRKSFDIIKKTGYRKYLVSNEFDRQFPRETDRIAREFPNAKIIMVLRRNDSWLASQYRRWVKNGFSGTFEEFIDLENDNGEWKQKDAYFYPYIQMIMDKFNSKPLVLLHDELSSNPGKFIKKIADFTGAEYNPDEISLNRVHTSYNKKQLLLRRKWNKTFAGTMKESNNRIIAFFQGIFYVKPIRYGALYLAKILPDRFVPREELTPEYYMEKIRKFYETDWKKCVEFAKQYDNE